LFAGVSDDQLLSYGVPAEWLADVHNANEDTLLELAGHLPSEAAEALLNLATGATPWVAKPIVAGVDPFGHPDAQRRFRVMANVEELERALDYPWEKWAVFLHPAQRSLVERGYSGPARVAGSAGTGKTIVALHRAVFLTRANPDARVLLTTFSDALSNALRTKLLGLISNQPRLGERLEVHSMNAIGRRLYEVNFGRPQIASRETMRELLRETAGAVEGNKFSLHFLLTEWEQVVDAWQLDSWEAYRDVVRLGRKTRLQEAQRVVLWSVFERVRGHLRARSLMTWSDVFSRVASKLRESAQPPFEFAVVDEAQDVSVQQLRFLAALGAGRPNSLFFAGDLGQRIFQQPFSWKALGVDVRGRSSTLRINYRTSHQIRKQADRLLGPEVSDVDGNKEDRRGTTSTFNGPQPDVMVLETPGEEIKSVSQWLAERTKEAVVPHEIGVFVRSAAELERARAAVDGAKLPYKVLDDHVETTTGRVSISTMHLAKGLEFRTVVVMACDDEVIPLQERIETVADDADLEEVYNTERHLLYVACTRARDHLLVTGVDPASEFLDDLRK
jgi:superfamily I DNA/RNA helicase